MNSSLGPVDLLRITLFERPSLYVGFWASLSGRYGNWFLLPSLQTHGIKTGMPPYLGGVSFHFLKFHAQLKWVRFK